MSTSKPQIPASPRGPVERPPTPDGKSFANPKTTVLPSTTTKSTIPGSSK